MPISGGTVTVNTPSTIPQSANAVETNVAAAVASTQLLATNAARKGFRIFNDQGINNALGSATMYISDGAAASATSFDFEIPPGGYYEGPVDFTGTVFALWTAATGSARVTELS